MLGRFFPMRGAGGGAAASRLTSQRRVSAGSMTSSISKHGGDADALAQLVRPGDKVVEQPAGAAVVGDGFQLPAVAEPDGAFEAHAAELARRPRDARQRGLRRAAHHRLGAEPVRLAEHDRHGRDRQVGTRHEQPVAVPHDRRRLDVGPDHDPRRVAQGDEREVERVAELHEPSRLVGAGLSIAPPR